MITNIRFVGWISDVIVSLQSDKDIQNPALDLGGPQRDRVQGPPPNGPPTMFMCSAICAACACHFVIFSKEVYLRSRRYICYR